MGSYPFLRLFEGKRQGDMIRESFQTCQGVPILFVKAFLGVPILFVKAFEKENYAPRAVFKVVLVVF